MPRRLIGLRNWLAEADRLSLDRAIQTCRRKGVEVGALPQAHVRDVFVSGIDGAGAQSIFVVAREGRKNAIASLLVKYGMGVRDAWARHGLSRAECDDLKEQLEQVDMSPPRSSAHAAPAHEIPLMAHVAALTVEAFAANRRSRPISRNS